MQDWDSIHKKFCGKKAYTFALTLVDSSDPVISRTFDVPSWFTFRQLHDTVQYAMTWTDSHLHSFTCVEMPSGRTRRDAYSARKELLLISGKDGLGYGDDMFPLEEVPTEDENKLKLSDVYEPTGRLYNVAVPRGEPSALMYLYDFGDNWEHQLLFKGSKPARAARPVFTAVSGCAPVEDCGGVYGWDNIKEAYQAPHPTEDQLERISWVKEIAGDAYNPLAEPDMASMNSQGARPNR
ncbi:hypothetical protein FIBSPDRAFT_951426 [Athelia psychrophila]|uniref:Plasmid pRiA4b Orf3-like domain-containing protein n=1 Tax=Athelia psychrophila TaxID=1759441 RepID=A0A166MLF6_9AGAM|nr:hypothetical protein FIBSPDRAFT_951426 [Fibularhizoctonia sp. CBS 109695]